MKEFVIIDGNSLLYRAYFAMIRTALFSPAGEPTGAVFGFANMLANVFENHRDAVIAVAFDKKGPTFRHEMYSEYKGTRGETDEDLIHQFPIARDMLKAFGVPVIEMDGYEADDIIGTLSKKAAEAGMDSYVYTGDKDALQLVQYGVKVGITKKGVSEIKLYDDAAVKEDIGVSSAQIIDYKALRGDPSDNIPGVKGVGEKTAVKLLTEYGSLENILENVDSIKPPRVSKLVDEGRDMAELSKKLATIILDLDIEPSDIHMAERDDNAATELFVRLGFNSLLKKYGLKSKGASEPTEYKSKSGKFSATLNPKPAGAKVTASPFGLMGEGAEAISIEPSAEGERIDIDRLSSKGNLDIFIEFASQKSGEGSGFAGEFLNVAVMDSEGKAAILDREEDFLKLKDLLEDEAVAKRFNDLKAAHLYCFSKGIDLCGAVSDAVIAAYLVSPARKSYEFFDIYRDFGGESLAPEKAQLSIFGEGEKVSLLKKVSALSKLLDALEEALKIGGIYKLYSEVEIPLVKVLADIEYTGFAIDLDVLAEQGVALDKRIKGLEEDIYEHAGEEFNISSPKQLGHILFEKLGLPPGRKTKTGYSTDKDVLDKLSKMHPVARLVTEYRTLTKLKSTYIDSLTNLARDGRIHTSLNQTIAVTGRLSSTEPNLQNIPMRLEEGRNIRKAFKSSEGRLLIDADYSQIELRVLAHLSGDPALQKAFNEGRDIHTATASEVFGVAPDEVTKLQRSHAKEVNFGIIYGMSDFGLSESLGIPVSEAKSYINRYFDIYRDVKTYMDSVVEGCRERGYVETLYGRRRAVPELLSKNKMVAAHGSRMARNTVIQGTAADIIKIAMVKLYDELRRQGLKSKLILQVHDELILDVPMEEREQAKKLLVSSMESAARLSVPLKVEVSEADNWYDA